VGFAVERASGVDVQMLPHVAQPKIADHVVGPNFRNDEQQGQPTASKDELRKAVNALNQVMIPHHIDLHFVLHEKLNEYYVQVVDTDTGDVIREIPPKKFLDMYAATLEFIGFLVDKKV
jgi:flagellar protein FlaG